MKKKVLLPILAFLITASLQVFADDDVQKPNGINVSPAMWFSDAALERMLYDARTGLEQADPKFAAAEGSVGKIQGVRSMSSSTAFDLTYKPIVSLKETITEKEELNEAGELIKTSTTEVVSNRNNPSQEIAIPSITINNNGGPDKAEGLGLGVSSLDNLAERVSLFYRYANLRYLFDKSFDQTAGKKSVLIGFDVSIDPRRENRYEAAEVVCTFTNPANAESYQKLDVAQIIPLKDTYNVISAVRKTSNIGLGIVLGPISLGGRQANEDAQMYLVQDVDTVAFKRELPDKIAFGWTFRPVLGRQYLSPGVRRVYALLTVPEEMTSSLIFDVSTGWREVDCDTGFIVGDLEKGKSNDFKRKLERGNQELAGPQLYLVGSDEGILPVDLGDDKSLVQVYGRAFNPQMSVRLGGEPVTDFQVDFDIRNNLTNSSKGWLLSFVANSKLLEKDPILSVRNDWASDHQPLSSLVKAAPTPKKSEGDGVELRVLSTGEEVLAPSGSDKNPDGTKDSAKVAKRTNTVVYVTAKSGLKNGHLVAGGKVFAFSTAKVKSDKIALFEIPAKIGPKDRLFYVDEAGKMWPPSAQPTEGGPSRGRIPKPRR